MTRRIFLDTEWTAPPWSPSSQLMWVGLADESGRTWSGISAEAEIDPERNDFISGVWSLISPDDPRMSLRDLAAAVREFCGDVDEFWAWVPTLDSVTEFFSLGPEAAEIYERYWDWDLQLLRLLIDPWPAGWPTTLHDLNAAATEAEVDLPSRQKNHLAPEVHVAWNRELFARIEAKRG